MGKVDLGTGLFDVQLVGEKSASTYFDAYSLY